MENAWWVAMSQMRKDTPVSWGLGAFRDVENVKQDWNNTGDTPNSSHT